MRSFAVALAFAGLAAPAAAQTPAPSPSPSPAPPAACAPREAVLGGIGHATVVSFRGPIFGGTVCAVVANLANDAFTASIADAPSAGALVVASLGSGCTVTVPLEGATPSGTYVIAPGGVIPSFGGDTAEAPRVVLAFSGQRVIVIGTTAIALVELARVLRTQPEIFGADAVERAVVIASGPAATVALRTAAGTLGVEPDAAQRVLLFMKRG
ncbi:MAG TPA: hypothetical protein VHT53_03845 [Candidatus Elarobacter sp.]|nr:hypothetical protein [Candidatus Elarobacter sp.]